MKQTVTKTQFTQAFTDYNRADSFSSEALEALFDYLENLEADTESEIELDVIGLCSDYSEIGLTTTFSKHASEAYEDEGERAELQRLLDAGELECTSVPEIEQYLEGDVIAVLSNSWVVIDN